MAELDKDPRPPMSRAYAAANTELANTIAPNLAELSRRPAPSVSAAYQRSGVGGAVGQVLNTLKDGVNAAGRDVGRAVTAATNAGSTLKKNVVSGVNFLDPNNGMRQAVTPAVPVIQQAAHTTVSGDTAPIQKPVSTAITPTASQADVRKAEPPGATAPGALPAPLVVAPAPTTMEELAASPPLLRQPQFVTDAEAAEGQRLRDESAQWLANRNAQAAMNRAVPVGEVDTRNSAPPVEAGGMISEQVAKLINAKRQRTSQALTLEKYKADQDAITAANVPFLRAAAQVQADSIDPSKQQAIERGKQELEQGAMTLADLTATTSLRNTLLDPAATPEQKQAAATSLRQLAGKDDEGKIAQYDVLGPDNFTVMKKAALIRDGKATDVAGMVADGGGKEAADHIAKTKADPAALAALREKFKTKFSTATPEQKKFLQQQAAPYGITL